MIKQINKYNIFIAFLILILGTIMIYSIKNTIDAFMLANQFDQGEKFVNIDQIKLDEVYEWSFNKEHVSLEISEAVISNINEEDNEIQEE